MKTISGKVVTTAPISLSKAAKVIANFASFDNGASEAVSIYLKRASEAFNALVQFHKDLKAPPSTALKHKKQHHPSINQQENGYSSVIKYEDDEQNTSQFGEANKSSKRESGEGREKKAKLEDGEVKIEGDGGGRVKVEYTVKDENELEEDDGVKKRDKKKRKKSEGEEGFEAEENVIKKKWKSGEQEVDSAQQGSKKNKKRRKVEGKD